MLSELANREVIPIPQALPKPPLEGFSLCAYFRLVHTLTFGDAVSLLLVGLAYTGLRISRQLPESPPELGKEDELVFFRVAQEGLTNAARHAQTDTIDLTLERTGTGIVLRVRDYGVGLDGSAVGSGIRGMRERALLVGADLTIRTASGGGTEVVLALPLEQER
jgi:two-component system, NarL family, sensor histidine kinase UhpB